MEPAHQHLNELETKEALPEEQKSLQQLMRAEALFNEIQVSFAQNQGGGGASAQDLADLVDLELDRTKNQYETLQQNRETNQEQALDEALEKLKELAKRQEQLVERHRQRGMQGSSGSNMSQQELIDEVERVARELERLSRQQQDPRLQNISRDLRQAVRDMRQAQSSGQHDQEAQMRAQQALERLQEAQQGLNQQRRQRLAEDLQFLPWGFLIARAQGFLRLADPFCHFLQVIHDPFLTLLGQIGPATGKKVGPIFHLFRDPLISYAQCRLLELARGLGLLGLHLSGTLMEVPLQLLKMEDGTNLVADPPAGPAVARPVALPVPLFGLPGCCR